ncbi:MAG: hypothetical protein JW976_00185 [Syntrophaceae bacterium]|nr:hypothetical protein [Syntrophaceae bacterium]
MRQYIFLTNEGRTLQPEVGGREQDIENMQVIGFATGTDPEDAFQRLLSENPYLLETSFERVVSYELARDYEKGKKSFDLKDVLTGSQ